MKQAESPKNILRDLRVAIRAISELEAFPRNPRTHSRKQIRQIADSIREFGFTNPILTDGDGQIIAGHGRIEAAKLLGMDRVPTIRLDLMTEAQKRTYILADNKLAINAGWDEEMLAIELQGLLVSDLDFDIGVTGFSIPEIDNLIDGLNPQEDDNPIEDALPPEGPFVSRIGDIWELGPHRVICGNALEAETYVALLGEERAQMVFTDPPYNVPIHGHVCGAGATQHREFVMASGEMTEEAFTSFLVVSA